MIEDIASDDKTKGHFGVDVGPKSEEDEHEEESYEAEC